MLHLLATFRSMPWAVEPSVMALMSAIVDRWSAGVRLSPDEISAAIGDAPESAARRQAQTAGMSGKGVQVIPVYGVLAHRAYAVANTSKPLTSTEALAAQVQAAADDPNVGTILLDVDSPGGSVFGVQELADTVAGARKRKHVVAQVNNTAASGAYWVASQASEIVVTPSGMVGSIGVIVPHVDTSAARERVGIKQEFITYGKFKAEGHIDGPMTDEHRAHLQSIVNQYGAAFTRDIAVGRRTDVETVRGPAFGEGRMKLAKDAVASGMADSIGTLEETIARLVSARPASRGGMRADQADRDIQILEA